jgi:catechol 2,3-dioxygenase-like lactoylglutathione lyase family enzyme
MSHIKQFDHLGITVADLDAVTAFFVGLGLEVEGRTFVKGEFIDTVIGIQDSRTEIVMLRPPGGGTGIELASFVRPDHTPGSPTAMATRWVCGASASRSTTCRGPSTAWLRTNTD